MADEESRKEKVEKRKKKSGWKKIGLAVVTVLVIIGGSFLRGNKKH